MCLEERRGGEGSVAGGGGGAEGAEDDNSKVNSSSSSHNNNIAPDPFRNKLEYTLLDKILLLLSLVTLFPLRVCLLLVSFVLAWLAGVCILLFTDWRTTGTTEHRPHSPAIRRMQPYFGYMGYPIYWSLGIWVRVRGVQASREEAPLIMGAPHSSFLDALIIMVCSCSVLERVEEKGNHFLWPAQQLMQNIFVDRSSDESRRAASETILGRVSSSLPWPQVLVYPEGLIGNGSCLLRFNKGCLAAGLPVQPLTIRYYTNPGKNYVSWANREYHPGLLLILTMCSLYTRLDLEFLPVYRPSQAECADPQLYANNLQKVIGDHMGIACTDLTRKAKKA